MPESRPSMLEEYASEVREPAGFRRPDADIVEEVRRALEDDVGLDARAIRVAVKDGKVTLAGTVRNCADMQRAEAHACAVAGAQSVLNELQPLDGTVDRDEGAEAGAAAKMGKPDYEC
ncbi:MAG: BON domain-containing protein [Alphaproteobacteria bacterium]|nr:BON domain-containing protein [Alphaproteobacteria bacterium]MBV8410786.1 BON domain-containing protein [Alphaproteobacteria bacterium]